jgi:hypothetical protein
MIGACCESADPICRRPNSLQTQFAYGDVVIHSLLPRRAAILGIALALGFPSVLAAQAATVPAPAELSPENAAGSYLAARHAGAERDATAAAAYYMDVLKLDPKNADLLSRTFLSVPPTATSIRRRSLPSACSKSITPTRSPTL